MAELIPLEYRIQVARKALLRRWSVLVAATAAVAVAWVLQTYLQRHQQAREFAKVSQEYQAKSVNLAQFNDLRARRDTLAQRMKNIEDIQGDKVLLSILAGVSGGMESKDTLNYLQIDAHPSDKKPEEARYSVRIRGITANDTTHSQLLERLTNIGKAAPFPLVVPLGEKHVSKILDGEATSFDITCQQPVAKGN